ncbi:MAG: BrnT family toxin [Rhodobacteraceae bacterium]|nr:BrnT family toxin [Paracoccaceae bacterium]
MKIVWDDQKRVRNLEKHGGDFSIFSGFRWDVAKTREDKRGVYGKIRYASVSVINGRHYVAAWMPRDGAYRLISLRKGQPQRDKGICQIVSHTSIRTVM